jgi:hypothetical protein
VLECLEGREAPAIFNVSAGDVAGLVGTINAANGNGQENTMNLAPGDQGRSRW